MRVISGKYRGRKLDAVQGYTTRPTLDRAKETIFNIIQYNIVNSRCLDCFGGTGQIAIELLSRGAQHVDVLDSDTKAVEVIKHNFANIGINIDDYKVYQGDYGSVLGRIDSQYNLVYIDPPYKSMLYVDVMNRLQQLNLLSDDVMVICECSKDTELPQVVGQLAVTKQRDCGTVRFLIYGRSYE